MSGAPKKTESSFLAELRGSAQPGEIPAPVRQSRPAWRSYVLVSAFAVVATAGMFGMRFIGRNAGMKLEKFDADFKPASGASAAQVTKVLDELAMHEAPLQVPGDAMKRNPFMLEVPKVEVAISNDPEPAPVAPQVDKEALARQALIADTLKGLSVTSVIRGQMPLARINDKLYRVGDRIGKVLDVIEITERGVTLSADGKQYTLSMKDEQRPDGDEGKAVKKPSKK